MLKCPLPIKFAIKYGRLCRKYDFNREVIISLDPHPYFDTNLNSCAFVAHALSEGKTEITRRQIVINLSRTNGMYIDLAHEFCHLLQYDSGYAYAKFKETKVLEEDFHNCMSEYAKTDYLEMQAVAFQYYENGVVNQRIVNSLSELFRVYSYKKMHEREGFVNYWNKNNIINSLRFNYGPLTTVEVLKACKTEKIATKSFIHLCD